MKITSFEFKEGDMIPILYTGEGRDINPPLEIIDVPGGAKSLALIIDDPDAPSGTFTHWLWWNADPQTLSIKENSIPQGAILGKTSFGNVRYGGPRPPSGVHRYFFRLFALDQMLDLPPGSHRSALEQAMEGHILESVELMGRYGSQS